MFSLEMEYDSGGCDLLVAELWERGCAGISELDDHRLRAFFEDTADRAALQEIYPDAILRVEEPRDWVQSARDLLQPMAVGARFFLVPEWRADPAPPGRFRIIVNPGIAFGTGVHETTQLCLEALEDYLKPGMTVVDVGTGSGILAEAATLLGAARVFACDVDPDAVGVARQRLRACFLGSADALCAGIADVAVANISPEAILQLAPDLKRALHPGGILLASGFEGPEVNAIETALAPVIEIRRKGNWALAVARQN